MEKETEMQILEPGYFSYKVRVKPETTLQMLERFDPVMARLLQQEEDRQRNTLGLIASENYASPLVEYSGAKNHPVRMVGSNHSGRWFQWLRYGTI
jgi:hypothetical protein